MCHVLWEELGKHEVKKTQSQHSKGLVGMTKKSLNHCTNPSRRCVRGGGEGSKKKTVKSTQQIRKT